MNEVGQLEHQIDLDTEDVKKEQEKLDIASQTLKDHKNLLMKKQELIKKLKEKAEKEKEL